MAKKILILEGDTPELALPKYRRTGQTAADGYAAAFREITPDLEIEIAQPYFSNHDADAYDLSAFDGMAVTGSGVNWSAADEQARPFWELYERAFAAGTPVVGSCWGMQLGAVALGGHAEAGPNGVEPGFAREVRPTDHPMHAGRRKAFDVIAMHRDDVTRAPEGAAVTATNEHTAIQAFAYDVGDVSFWGVQYHPECTLGDVAHWFSRDPRGPWEKDRRREAADIARVAEDPAYYARLAAKHRIGIDILDRGYHLTELRNWLEQKVL